MAGSWGPPGLQAPPRAGNRAGDPWATAAELIEADELLRAALLLANTVRDERKLSKGQHAAILLAGLTAGRRGGEALRSWVATLRAESKPVQASLL